MQNGKAAQASSVPATQEERGKYPGERMAGLGRDFWLHDEPVAEEGLVKLQGRFGITLILCCFRVATASNEPRAYVTAFLAHRTAEISYGPLSSPSFSLGNKGAPQGSVLSPLLFNVTLFPLARALRTIPALSHAFYADDITLWVTTGNLGDMETTLQAGVDAVATPHAQSEHSESVTAGKMDKDHS
ncbi:hypothetical protein HPB49_022311 [Dermacentor silvarum]|uniref:Uncharacterized protein n=1 Tax=Dermacentor silvarum TaxID=543639 RepID=A0ACB8DR95_DERSI|nr:hypothetical protein HPB49_022311 [Dermacentor silvarum]